MILSKIRISNYKNLKDCTIFPKGLFALTGCNSSGKSNFIEVFRFVSLVISGSDEQRNRLLLGGVLPNGTNWTPEFVNFENFSFLLECTFKVNSIEWELSYELEISHVQREEIRVPAQIFLEKLCMKEVGKPGKATEIILRTKEGDTKVTRIEEPRNKEIFKTKSNMSALQSLEVREADTFAQRFPILAEFKKSFLSSNLLLLNPRHLVNRNTFQSKTHYYLNAPGAIIDEIPLYDLLKVINDGDHSKEFYFWLNQLCSINKITFHEKTIGDDPEKEKYTFILLFQFGRVLLPNQLSTGCAMMMGILIAVYSFLQGNGFILLEEPEIYLHPKAIMDLMRLFRKLSQTKSVIFSTHSPVVLNSMKPEEVALMIPTENYKATTKNVADIKEAIDALSNGFMSFGDLLQSNFKTSKNEKIE